ncbi:hypothetical protein ACMAZE_09275 [Pseudopelagicola sp. nBUS_20]|uniref:hypothetical protein n=1 Tax=Pseudopelagicola sp. nBUS_20 TaxID=3395317 RepID=UPI003EC0EF1B
MRVGRKGAAGRKTDDGSGAGDFFTNPIEHLTVYTGHRGSDPFVLLEAYKDAFIEVSIHAHGLVSFYCHCIRTVWLEVLSDQFKPLSVCHRIREPIQNKSDTTRIEQRLG